MIHSGCAMNEIRQNGTSHQPQPNGSKAVAVPIGIPTGDGLETKVSFKTEAGANLVGVPVQVNRQAVVFELYGTKNTTLPSELVKDFKISLYGGEVYSGRAVILNLIDAGSKIICEARLNEADWADLQLEPVLRQDVQLKSRFDFFLNAWQKNYKISGEFKEVVADMQSFLHDLRLWTQHLEVAVQGQPKSKQPDSERQLLQQLQTLVFPKFASLFERFEKLIQTNEKDLASSYSNYARRLLHPLVLGSPFMRRTFEKPLGYAGDYQMVAMMTRDPFEGDSFYAKLLNAFFINTPPVVAHRNRIDVLVHRLQHEATRVASSRRLKVFNLGCGPALEIQRFLLNSALGESADFTLLDFNTETVDHATRIFQQLKQKHKYQSTFKLIKKSVAQLLKDSSQFGRGTYDFVYCAGLFDYLPDTVCARLMEVFYDLVAPGGLVLVTNVHVNNPSRGWMEYMVDWNLVYRDAVQMAAIIPNDAPRESTHISIESIGVNIFAEVRKPENG
jgi:extracellular factor (EF) 3-hydroxypalmitic acid methyl ester biosynthesis protein